MTQNYTAITVGAAANAATINAPLDQLDDAIGAAVSTLTTSAKTVVGAVNEMDADMGAAASTLTTTAKNFTGAINELDADMGAAASTLTTTAKNFTGAINELNALIMAIEGGSTVTVQQLKDWTEGECYEMVSASYDTDDVITTATVKWPDASSGTFTTTTKNTSWLSVDAYTISHAASGKTVTQAAVTRNTSGAITVKPALTVA